MPMPSEAEMYPGRAYSHRVDLRLDDELLASVERRAKGAYMTPEEYIRSLIRQDAAMQRFAESRKPG